MQGYKGSGGESLPLLPQAIVNASPEPRREEIDLRHPEIPALDPGVRSRTPAAWFFLLAEELPGQGLPDTPWGKDPGSLKWSDARRYVLMRDGRTCAMHSCRQDGNLTVHHILPRAYGGTHHPGNLVTLCTRCHRDLCDTCTRSVNSRVPPLFLPP